MGTVMMGKRVGYVQAAVMVAGFCLVMVYFAAVFTCSVRYINSSEWTVEGFRSCYGVYLPTLFRGLGFCAVAWVWSLFSSIAMLRRGRSNKKTPP